VKEGDWKGGASTGDNAEGGRKGRRIAGHAKRNVVYSLSLREKALAGVSPCVPSLAALFSNCSAHSGYLEKPLLFVKKIRGAALRLPHALPLAARCTL